MSTPTEALHLLRAPDQRHQGRAHTDVGEVTAERLAAVEAHAVSVRAWNPSLIPGLLQTTRYAAGAIGAARPSLPAEDVQRYAHHRAARVDQFLQRWGSRPETGTAWFVIGEQSITTPLVHGSAHQAQLKQLLNVSQFPKVELRVMPAGRTIPGRPGQMTLYGLAPAGHDQGQGARLGLMETPVGAFFSLRSPDMARLHTVFAAIIEAALDADPSRSLIWKALAA